MPLVARPHRPFHSASVLLLCGLLLDSTLLAALPPAIAATSSPRPAKHSPPPRQAPLTAQQRTLHALNRLTFGPRPGQVDAVTREGLDRWFERQLNPQSLDDSALETRLNAFPAMRLPQAELVARFPSNQLIREAARRDFIPPTDPVTRAIYTDGIAFGNQDQARKAEAQPTPAASGTQPAVANTASKRLPRPDLLGPTSLYTIAYSPKKPAAAALSDRATTMADAITQPRPRSAPQHREDLFPEAATTTILHLAPAARVSRLLGLAPADLAAFRQSLTADELSRLAEGLSPAQEETLAALQSPQRVVTAELLGSRLERDVYSSRQLEAVMTDFWLNHFNVFLHKNEQEPYLLPSFERDVIRHNALGHFENLLVAVASSPAMLVYLDNAESIGPDSPAAVRAKRPGAPLPSSKTKPASVDRGLNENYARELLELHTLGVRCEASKDHTPTDKTCGPGYTQADITDIAKVLTGWTVDRPALGNAATYDERRHQPGDKHVLGTTIAGNGEKEGLQLLHLLATSPATARFLSTELAVRFVSDDPPPALVDRMTAAWLKSNGDLRVVLRTLFHSPEFWSPSAYRAKIKTPLEFVASALRASDADIINPAALVGSLDRLGMPLYGMTTPNGYSSLSESWVSTSALITRMNFALVLAGGRIPGVTLGLLPASSPANSAPRAPTLVSASDPQGQELALEHAILGEAVSSRTREVILQQAADPALAAQAKHDFPGSAPEPRTLVKATASNRSSQLQSIAGLLLGSPDFQRR